MPKYMCPECEAVLKRQQPVPTGKKIKCPKCEFIFLAKALPGDDDEGDEGKKKTPAAEAPKKQEEAKKPVDPDDDEDAGGTYGVTKEKAEDASPPVKFEDLRKKFPKSKRGPAMAMTVMPSNLMMLLGMVQALLALGWFMRFLWPFVFSNEPPTGNKATNYVLLMVAFIVLFCIDCLICYGASKMHQLESIGWAWAATVLVIVFCGILGWAVGAYAVNTLNSDEVKEGFEETLERASELKNMHGP